MIQIQPAPEGLEFDEALHKYSMQGRPVPGVTEVLESVGITDFEFVNADVLEYAKQLGTAVHRGCELYDTWRLEKATVDPVVRQYIQGWIKFRTDYDVDVLKNELRVYDPIYCYAGTLDKIVKIWSQKEKKVLIDIKSGEKTRSAPIQTAAYIRAYQSTDELWINELERWCIYLDKEGGYQRVIHREYEKDISVFLGALSVYVYKQNNR